MKKIAYITERKLDGEISGAITRDFILLKILKSLGEVTLYYADAAKYFKYEYVWNNTHISPIVEEINNKQYDIVIISAYQTGPYLTGYRKIIHKKIFYLCDSAFFMKKNTGLFNLKYQLVTRILCEKERGIIKHECCAYLGQDEINSIPQKYRTNAIILPFYIDQKSQNYFNENGYVLYIGNFSYWPNREALKKIIAMAPYINSMIKIFGLHIPKIKRLPQNVIIAGYADTLDEVYIGAKALVYPSTFGTGIKNKVIEAMSYGIPVIGFKNAFTNMPVEHNKNVIIVKKDREIVEALKRSDMNIISKNAYLFIKKEMSESFALSCVTKYI